MHLRSKPLTRRGFLRCSFAAAAAAAAGVGGYAWRIEPHWIEIVERPLPVPGLPGPLDGRSLGLISDLHIGSVVDEEYITSAVQKFSSLGPDIIVIAGDTVNDGTGEALDQASRVLEHLAPGRLENFCILGNHDYGFRWSQTSAADRVAARYGDLGFTVLRDECRTLEGLVFAGIEDYWSPRFNRYSAKAALEKAKSKPAIALCHNPDTADEPIWSGFEGWILSGHTHGGQFNPPLFDPPFLPVKNKRYVAGEVDLGSKRKLYISRGLGYLRRVRFNMRPEITVFTLRKS